MLIKNKSYQIRQYKLPYMEIIVYIATYGDFFNWVMRKITMDTNDFFREATLRLCGNLEIEEGLRSCIEYFSQHMPADVIYLERFDPDLGAMHIIARATKAQGERMDVLVPFTTAAREKMVQLADVWRAGELPNVLVINKPKEEPVTRCLLEALKEPYSSAMSLPLIIEMLQRIT